MVKTIFDTAESEDEAVPQSVVPVRGTCMVQPWYVRTADGSICSLPVLPQNAIKKFCSLTQTPCCESHLITFWDNKGKWPVRGRKVGLFIAGQTG